MSDILVKPVALRSGEVFSPRRYAHSAFIWLPRTVQSATPCDEPHNPRRSELDRDFIEAGFDHMEATGLSDGICWNADTLRCFWHGA